MSRRTTVGNLLLSEIDSSTLKLKMSATIQNRIID
jgi:hypothetical protein